jgi:bifunctional UDP-N-acetylglucosamine pyrophosphorylase/glucosamine-1-phosphate N-acetyltransferase
MSQRRIAAIVLAAGHGTRMKSDQPKVLHQLAGQPMVSHILGTLLDAGVERIRVVVGPGMKNLVTAVAPHETAVQIDRLGTAHAALAAKDAIGPDYDDLLILNGDNPLIPKAQITALLKARQAQNDPAVVVLGFQAQDAGPYGRLITHQNGVLERIVEAKDASEDELKIDLCSSGMMALDGKIAFQMLSEIGNDNAAGEYYLPDVVGVAQTHDRTCAYVLGDEGDLLGINSRAELASAEARLQTKYRSQAMDGGATLVDPETVYFSADTKIGRDVIIEPNVFIGSGVTISDGAHIKAFCHLEGANIGPGAVIGPFARLRPGSQLAENVKIGNFVEIKNADLAKGAKVNHLSYVGDADVGSAANIGAGTITCNYDGVFKWRTTIGAGAFIGSNSALVAPVTIGDGATVAAGSTIGKDVSAEALGVTRAPQKELPEWSKRTRERKLALKAKGEKG